MESLAIRAKKYQAKLYQELSELGTRLSILGHVQFDKSNIMYGRSLGHMFDYLFEYEN